MKEELLRVLNNKLNSINSDIDSLKELNRKIDEETESLDFIDSTVKLFDEDGQTNPLNFDKILKDDFTRVLEIGGDEVKRLFSSNACNYDGLIYLINGIKSGVQLSLTNEQLNGIEVLIRTLTGKKEEITNKVNELNGEKNNYKINDLNELKTEKDKYEDVISKINKDEYIKEVDLLKEAISFVNLPAEDTIKVLSYVLEYNANIYKEDRPVKEEKEEIEEKTEEKEETEPEVEEEAKEEEKEEPSEEVPEETPVEEPQEEVEDNGFHFNQIENDNLFDLPNITFEDKEEPSDIEEKEETEEVPEETPAEEPQEEVEETKDEEIQEFKPQVEEETPSVNNIDYIPVTEETHEEPKEESIDEIPVAPPIDEVEEVHELEPSIPVEETPISPEPFEEAKEEVVEEKVEPVEETPSIDSDFKDVIDEKADYETREKQEEEKTSTRELHKIFSKYGIEENVVLNELIDGDVKIYQSILDLLKERNVLDSFKKNKELLIETLLYSSNAVIDKVLTIIKEDLSVDDEDYEITRKIAINTIPSIFINEGGNYNNFIKNVELFKKLEINLINLFDFSKEIFIADHDSIENNLAIVNKYDIDITYRDAKYFLLIPNIEEKLDYYIESVYVDKSKNETFDGIKYIKEYAPKLNVVTDETIKRLRYASETGSKVFGNKPGSLTGEITNLKVHALTLSDDYLSKFFNNTFNNITSDEVREYAKLVRDSSNVGDYSDELDKLNPYRNGLRYVIEGINVSCNKVFRNYSVLRSYGIDNKKALEFAVCYNLIITKDEYNKLSDFLEKIGGNA